MTIYWSFSKVPELVSRTEAERADSIKMVGNLAMKHWEWWLALSIAAAFAGIGALLGGKGISGAVGAGIGGAIGGALHHLAVIYVARKYHSAVLAGKSDA
jgi:hypothetical protein